MAAKNAPEKTGLDAALEARKARLASNPRKAVKVRAKTDFADRKKGDEFDVFLDVAGLDFAQGLIEAVNPDDETAALIEKMTTPQPAQPDKPRSKRKRGE